MTTLALLLFLACACADAIGDMAEGHLPDPAITGCIVGGTVWLAGLTATAATTAGVWAGVALALADLLAPTRRP